MDKKRKPAGLQSIFNQENRDLFTSVNTSSKDMKNAKILLVDKIDPNPFQPRTNFDQKEIETLAQSIKVDGLITPIAVVSKGDRFVLVAGERRLRAFKHNNMKEISGIIVNVTDRQLAILAYLENSERKDLNGIEEAKAFSKWKKDFKMTQEEIAKTAKKSRSYVANSLRLLKLPIEVKEMVENGALSTSHARTLLSINNSADILKQAKKILEKGLTVRHAETIVANKKGKKRSKENKVYSLEEKSIKIKHIGKNSISITFYNTKTKDNFIKRVKKEKWWE